MTKDEALKLALEALDGLSEPYDVLKAQEAIREALAQPEQEPVACVGTNGELMWLNKSKVIYSKPIPLYTTPPQRKPLSNQKIIEMYNEPRSDAEMIEFARAIEAAHGIWPENSDCYGPDWTDRDGEYLK